MTDVAETRKKHVLESVTFPVPRAAYGAGGPPTIGIVNLAKTPLGYDLNAMVAAMQESLDKDFAPIWESAVGAKLQVLPDQAALTAEMWPFFLIDTMQEAGALGYHDLTQAGLPVAFIGVQTTIQDGGDVAVTSSHELWEMLVDPAIQMWTDGPRGRLYAWETADAVEETDYLVNAVRISNFLYPSWFEVFRKPGSIKFDHLGLCTQPFQLLKGGYSIIQRGGATSQIFGSRDKQQRFAREERLMHRSTARITRTAVQYQSDAHSDIEETSPV